MIVTRRRLTVLALLAALSLLAVLPTVSVQAQSSHDYVVVKLQDPATASYEGGIPGLERTKPQPGEKLDLTTDAARDYRAHLAAERAKYKSWLASNAPAAEVVAEFDVVFNGLAVLANGTPTSTLANGPGAVYAVPSGLYEPTMNVSLDLIGADTLWRQTGIQKNGNRLDLDAVDHLKVGVIDTGIDDTHPFIVQSGCRDASEITHQVYFSGEGTEDPDQTLFFDHGTHVAGTIGGCPVDGEDTNQPVEGTLSGVAPGVQLHDYNVFPGYGAGFIAFGGSAFSHDIIEALEDTVADGMDVVNMSLGGGVDGPHDPLAEATDSVADAGVIPAVAAGNSGPGDSTVQSPGNARGAITAGASTNPHFVGISVSVNGLGTFGAALGDFDNFSEITAPYTVTEPADGCSDITNDVSGEIALIDRGACTFTTKIRNAEEAGAIGVLVVNNVAGDPVAMAHDGTDPFPTIPAAMVGKDDGNAMKPSGEATVDPSLSEFLTDNEDIIAGFSSRGPTPFTYLIKPDVTAPGVNVLSSVFEGKYAFFQGTSMATPHVAGTAVLVKALNPGWSVEQVKSGMVNTAKRPVYDHVTGTEPTGVLTRGGGRIDLTRIGDTPATLVPASASFGLFTGNTDANGSVDITVTNVSGSSLSCAVGVEGSGPVSASTGQISLSAGGSTVITLTLSGGKTLDSGDYQGDLVLDCGSDGSLLEPYWTRVERESGGSRGG